MTDSQAHRIRRWRRWAYALFVTYAVVRIPTRTGFALDAPRCDLRMDGALLLEALGKVPHVVLFGAFFLMTWTVLAGGIGRRFVIAMAATLLFGLVIELEQGMTGTGNCRLRDLVPDAAGGLVAFVAVMVWERRPRMARRREPA